MQNIKISYKILLLMQWKMLLNCISMTKINDIINKINDRIVSLAIPIA